MYYTQQLQKSTVYLWKCLLLIGAHGIYRLDKMRATKKWKLFWGKSTLCTHNITFNFVDHFTCKTYVILNFIKKGLCFSYHLCMQTCVSIQVTPKCYCLHKHRQRLINIYFSNLPVVTLSASHTFTIPISFSFFPLVFLIRFC